MNEAKSTKIFGIVEQYVAVSTVCIIKMGLTKAVAFWYLYHNKHTRAYNPDTIK